MKIIISILLILVYTVMPVFGTRTIEERTASSDKSGYKCSAPREKCAAVLGLSEERYDELICRIAEAEKNFDETCDISDFNIRNSFDAERTLYNAVRLCYPENFHLEYSYVLNSSDEDGDDETISEIVFFYKYDKDQYQEILKQVEDDAAVFLEGVRDNDALTDLQKAIVLHDRINERCHYSTAGDCGTIDGALCNGACVCDGYSAAYAYLLDAVGIENYYVENYHHIWNVIYIDKEPYYVDVQMDDGLRSGAIGHILFLYSYAKMQNMREQEPPYYYDDTPSSDIYDDEFWNDVDTSFVVCGDAVYYAARDGVIYRWDSDGRKAVCDMSGEIASDLAGYEDPSEDRAEFLSRCGVLCSWKGYIYYTTPCRVVRYSPTMGTIKTVYTFDRKADNGNYGIVGLWIRAERVGVEIYDPIGQHSYEILSHHTKRFLAPGADGDSNCDSDINMKDVLLLRKVLAGAEELAGYGEFLSDLNGDGNVTMKDVLMLRKIIAGDEKHGK